MSPLAPADESSARPDDDSAAPARGVSGPELGDLVEGYADLVYRLAAAIVHDHSLAEDVVQDVMFKAWRSLPDGDGDVRVRWLRTVTRNTAIDVLRHRRFDDVTASPPEPRTSAAGPERIVEGRRHLGALWSALGELDADARTMLALREVEGMSYDDIAITLAVTASAVKAKLYRARHQLRRALTEWDNH